MSNIPGTGGDGAAFYINLAAAQLRNEATSIFGNAPQGTPSVPSGIDLMSDGFGVGARNGGFVPPGLPNLGDLLYKNQLGQMSEGQLKGEEFKQQLRQLVALFTGDTQGAQDAQHKLGMVRAEESKRQVGDLGMIYYKQNITNLTVPQLRTEERKQMGAMLRAALTGDADGAMQAREKLAAVRHELDGRGPTVPQFPVPRMPLEGGIL